MALCCGRPRSKASIAPHWVWPQTTTSLTSSDSTANSIAAAVELVLPVTPPGDDVADVLTTNRSPGLLCVMSSAARASRNR